MKYLFVILISFSYLHANDYIGVPEFLHDEAMILDLNKYKAIKAIILTESTGDSLAVNLKFSKSIPYDSLASGLVQLTPIMISEANRIIGFKKYLLIDRFNASKSIEIIKVVLEHKTPDFDIKKVSNVWFCGHVWKHNEEYYKKVLSFY
jgi:hypothetical protein